MTYCINGNRIHVPSGFQFRTIHAPEYPETIAFISPSDRTVTGNLSCSFDAKLIRLIR